MGILTCGIERDREGEREIEGERQRGREREREREMLKSTSNDSLPEDRTQDGNYYDNECHKGGGDVYPFIKILAYVNY